MAKLSFLRKDQKEHLKGEVGQAKRGTGPEMMKYQGLKMAGCLDIYLGGHELTILIDSCKLHTNRFYCAYLSHNSVCYNKTYVCLQCRRPGLDPWVRKIPWRRAWQPTSVFLPGKSP